MNHTSKLATGAETSVPVALTAQRPLLASRRTSAKRLLAASLCIALASTGLQATAASPPATSWDASGEFNDQLPSGPVWSYGYLPAGSNTFTPFVPPTSSAPCLTGIATSIPMVAHNPLMTTCSTSVTLAPRALVMHPGWNGETAVLQFKAPYSAQYKISGQFYGIDGNPQQTHTSVSIVANNAPVASTLYSGTIALPSQGQASFTYKLVMLQANQTLQFRVKASAGYTAANASTGLHGLIQYAGPWCGMTNPPDPASSTC